MPELPEVETIVRQLQAKIRGKQILSLETNTPRLFRDHKREKEKAVSVAVHLSKELEWEGGRLIFVRIVRYLKRMVTNVKRIATNHQLVIRGH